MRGISTFNRKMKNGELSWGYRFDTAPINGKRKQISKSGFISKEEALEAGINAKQKYDNILHEKYNKNSVVENVVNTLNKSNILKKVPPSFQTISITDGNGNSKEIEFPIPGENLFYTYEDVSVIINAFLYFIQEAISKGREVNLHGFGTFKVGYRAERQTKHPVTGEPVVVNPRYVPKFKFGGNLRIAAEIYEESVAQSRAQPLNDNNKSDEISFEDYYYKLTGEKI